MKPRRDGWLGFLTMVAFLVTGCAGTEIKPAASEIQAVSGANPGEAVAPARLPFAVIGEADLPAELVSMKNLTELPKSTLSARVGDFLYVAVVGGVESIGASGIAATAVELVEQPSPIISVWAEVTPGKTGAEIMTFPRTYIRIPYAARLPVPRVWTRAEVVVD